MPTDPISPIERTLTVVPTGPETLGVDAPAVAALPAGQRFGDYELLDELARGGMGVVYRARQVSVNRVVALKMILAGRFASGTEVQRFRQEAEAAANLDHPNILPIYEVGQVEGRSYFTMKLVEGGSLSELLSQGTRTNVRGLISLLEQVVRGVHYAHQRGVLHRDLKPSNILLVDAATPVIADFGLAKKVEGDSSLTQSGAILGTPSYMAPEQARGSKAITTAADIYSLGAILYELLAGQPPFKGESIAQTLRMVEEQEPVAPRHLNPTADADLEAVALKCLEKDPAGRYETAGALADDLTAWLGGKSVTARRASPTRRAWKWVKRNPAVSLLALSIVTTLVAGASISAVYAVKADKRAKEAAANEQEARKQEAAVKEREEDLREVLDAMQFQQARALRLAGRPGWRGRSLSLIHASARNLGRVRENQDRPIALPDLTEVRGEAVMALLAHDAQPVREVPFAFASTTQISGDGTRMFQATPGPDAPGVWSMLVRDLTTGQEVDRRTARVPTDFTQLDKIKVDPAYIEIAQLLNVKAVNKDATLAIDAGGPNGGLTIHQVPSGRVSVRLTGTGGNGSIATARFSPDGRRVAAVCFKDKQAELLCWDVARPDTPRVLERRTEKLRDTSSNFFTGTWSGDFGELRFAPDGARLSFGSADRKAVRILDVSTDPPKTLADVPVSGELVAAEWHPTESVLAVLARAETRMASATIWDLKASKVLATCDAEFSPGSDFGGPFVAFSPNGRWLAVTGGIEPTIRVFGARDGVERFRLTDAVSLTVTRLFWTPASELGAAGVMESIRVWRPDPDPACDTFYRLRAAGRPAFSPDGRWLAVFAPTGATPAPNVKRRNAERDRPMFDRVALIDRRTGEVARLLPGLSGHEGRVLFSPDGRRVVVADETELKVWDTSTGSEVLARTATASRKWKLLVHVPDGRLVAIADDAAGGKGPSKTTLWDVSTDQPISTFDRTGLNLSMSSYLASPDGRHLLIPPTSQIPVFAKVEASPGRVLELPSLRPVAEVPAIRDPMGAMSEPAALAPGGTRALWFVANLMTAEPGAGGAAWRVQSLSSGNEQLRVPIRTYAVEHAFDFSPDGRYLAVGSNRGQVELWDVDAGNVVFRWQPYGGRPVHALAFTPEGDIATVADGDGRLSVLRMKEIRDRLTEMGLGW
jgi:WD40 repeat protein/predicted Ser/Thr protein kinase